MSSLQNQKGMTNLRNCHDTIWAHTLTYLGVIRLQKDENRINNTLALTIALNVKDEEKIMAALHDEALTFFELNLN